MPHSMHYNVFKVMALNYGMFSHWTANQPIPHKNSKAPPKTGIVQKSNVLYVTCLLDWIWHKNFCFYNLHIETLVALDAFVYPSQFRCFVMTPILNIQYVNILLLLAKSSCSFQIVMHVVLWNMYAWNNAFSLYIYVCMYHLSFT